MRRLLRRQPQLRSISLFHHFVFRKGFSMSMRFSTAITFALITTTLCFLGLAGCNQGSQDAAVAPEGKTASTVEAKEEYNPHDVPITEEQKTQLKNETAQFSAAVAKIKEFRDATEQETKNGIPENPYKAHQALDQADLVLQWLPQVARDSGVAKDLWEEINTAANELRTSFEKVHQNVDNKQDPNFAAVAQEIDQKIARLQEIAQATGAKSDNG